MQEDGQVKEGQVQSFSVIKGESQMCKDTQNKLKNKAGSTE